MVDEEPKDISPTGGPVLGVRDILAARRTALAVEGSFKGWIRTGLSLISFGFSIYEILMSLQSGGPRRDPVEVGLFLIGLGTVTLLYGIYEYLATSRELQRVYGVRFNIAPLIFGSSIAALGVIMFFTILARVM